MLLLIIFLSRLFDALARIEQSGLRKRRKKCVALRRTRVHVTIKRDDDFVNVGWTGFILR